MDVFWQVVPRVSSNNGYMLHAMYSTNSKQLLDEAEYHLKNYTDYGEISIIRYMIRKANSMIVLLFILNNSLFKNTLIHTHLHRC